MSFGIEIRNASGVLMFSASDKLTRSVYTTSVAAGASGSASVTGVIAAKAVGFAVTRTNNLGDFPPTVTVTDGNVAWSGGNGSAADIFVFMTK